MFQGTCVKKKKDHVSRNIPLKQTNEESNIQTRFQEIFLFFCDTEG